MIKKQSEALIPTRWGRFKMLAYAEDRSEKMPHLALIGEGYDPQKRVLVRMHSECVTGDLFGSKRCDCGEQLEASLRMANAEGGLVLYLRQEGRGIGIIHKLDAYQLQDKGLDTIEANTHLGFEPDARQYDDAIAMLQDLGIKKIRLLTNNPLKIEALEHAGFDIVRTPLEIKAHQENRHYLQTKREQMGHLLRKSFLD